MLFPIILDLNEQSHMKFEFDLPILFFMLITIILPQTFIRYIYKIQGNVDSCLTQECL